MWVRHTGDRLALPALLPRRIICAAEGVIDAMTKIWGTAAKESWRIKRGEGRVKYLTYGRWSGLGVEMAIVRQV